MVTENAERFFEAVNRNAEMKARMDALRGMPENALRGSMLALAREYGFDLAETDFPARRELSEEELCSVSGGLGDPAEKIGVGDMVYIRGDLYHSPTGEWFYEWREGIMVVVNVFIGAPAPYGLMLPGPSPIDEIMSKAYAKRHDIGLFKSPSTVPW